MDIDNTLFTFYGLNKVHHLYRLTLLFCGFSLIIGLLLGLLIGYMGTSALYSDFFTQELRWHYAPVKWNETSYASTKYENYTFDEFGGKHMMTEGELCPCNVKIPCYTTDK